MTTSCDKFGRIALVSENDGSEYSARVYLHELICRTLDRDWDIDLLLLNNGAAISSRLQDMPHTIFEHPSGVAHPMMSPSSMITSALDFKEQIGSALPLYRHLKSTSYDAVIFVGLSPAMCSLLPLTHKKNCMIPLLAPGDWHDYENNQALKSALLNCDYFLCHSQKESAFISSFQPYAEVRHFPLMMDPERTAPNSQRQIEPGSSFILAIAESMNPTVMDFVARFLAHGHRVVLALDKDSRLPEREGLTVIDMATLIDNFQGWVDRIKGAVCFLSRKFFPIFYNLCQYNVPIFLAPNYPWHRLIDGNGYSFLTPGSVPDFYHAPDSRNTIPYGYQHHSYYVNYWIRFLQEWCVNNKLRCERGAWQFPKPAPAKRTVPEDAFREINQRRNP